MICWWDCVGSGKSGEGWLWAVVFLGVIFREGGFELPEKVQTNLQCLKCLECLKARGTQVRIHHTTPTTHPVATTVLL